MGASDAFVKYLVDALQKIDIMRHIKHLLSLNKRLVKNASVKSPK
ncbi:hypothetical protein GNIT_2904 [Glaciecola nitratireducens FR1064]|uniref:Uncharacterized protein n=1 Tax=Glaciecola nitratireducens (strain JCM 12485 / KCTC 12276 / FR1064) TaxID=1085623 RepID=G4QMR8_GLANF|nr:hypothetical protein GNIT_2904 [Glaciecola nitratireducens FR1064]